MVTLENYEEYMLLEADGELTEAEQKEFYAFLDLHPELRNELSLYKATKLLPDDNIIYEHKEQLLKTSGGKRTINVGGWWMYGAVAACLAFVFFLLKKPTNRKTSAVTVTHNQISRPATNSQPQVQQELHSKPTNPIAIETKKIKQQPVETIAKIKRQPVTEPLKQTLPEPVEPVQQKELPVARKNDAPLPNIKPEAPVEKTEEYVKTPVVTQPEPSNTEEVKENRKLLALLPETKLQGISEIAAAVNEKIEKVKTIKNKLKDTDISFKIGNKELFVVKL